MIEIFVKVCGSFAAGVAQKRQAGAMKSCPVCGARLDPGVEMEIEKERYVGSLEYGAEMTLFLPFCNRGKNCNPVIAANRMDELAAPFLAAVGNG